MKIFLHENFLARNKKLQEFSSVYLYICLCHFWARFCYCQLWSWNSTSELFCLILSAPKLVFIELHVTVILVCCKNLIHINSLSWKHLLLWSDCCDNIFVILSSFYFCTLATIWKLKHWQELQFYMNGSANIHSVVIKFFFLNKDVIVINCGTFLFACLWTDCLAWFILKQSGQHTV